MIQGLGALQERPFRNLYLARAFSLLGDGIVPVALAFAVLSIEGSATALGLVIAARAASQIGFMMIGGVIADRLPRRQILIASDLLRLVTQTLIAVLLFTETAQVWHMAALAFIYGIGDAFFRPTSTGIIPQTVSPGRMQQANALIALTQSTFIILGPVLAGLILAFSNPGTAFAIDAATFLVSVLFVLRLPVIPAAARQAASFLSELGGGWREFMSRVWLRVDGIYAALGTFAVLAPLFTLGPVFANNNLGGASAWATIMTAFGVGSVVGGIGLLRGRPARPLVAALVPLPLIALPGALMALGTPTLVIAAGAFLGGLGLSVFNTLFETTVMLNVPQNVMSRVAAIDWMLSGSLLPLGAALAGPAADAFSVAAVFTFSAVWMVASTVGVLAIPEIRRFRDTPIAAPSTSESETAPAPVPAPSPPSDEPSSPSDMTESRS